jgi:hypothetical protein
VKKAGGSRGHAERFVGNRLTLVAEHQIRDFGVGLQPLLPLVVAPAQESEFPSNLKEGCREGTSFILGGEIIFIGTASCLKTSTMKR